MAPKANHFLGFERVKTFLIPSRRPNNMLFANGPLIGDSHTCNIDSYCQTAFFFCLNYSHNLDPTKYVV